MSKKAKKQENTEINPYELDKLSKIPSWLIIIILKYWAAAAAVFFGAIGAISIGFDFSQSNDLDPIAKINTDSILIVLLAFIMAVISNYAIKQVVILLNNRRNNTFKFNIINLTGIKAFGLYLVYSFIMSVILYFVTMVLSYYNLIFDPFGTSQGVGIEPFTYALCYLIIDSIFVAIKNLIVMLYQRIKYNKQIRSA